MAEVAVAVEVVDVLSEMVVLPDVLVGLSLLAAVVPLEVVVVPSVPLPLALVPDPPEVDVVVPPSLLDSVDVPLDVLAPPMTIPPDVEVPPVVVVVLVSVLVSYFARLFQPELLLQILRFLQSASDGQLSA